MLILLFSFASFLFLCSKSSPSLLSRFLAEAKLVVAFASRGQLPKMENQESQLPSEEEGGRSVLDLPELVLDCILEKLSPAGLCNMSSVCSSLKDRCRSDHLWGRHTTEKWGHLLGEAAVREWRSYACSKKEPSPIGGRTSGFIGKLLQLLPLSWRRCQEQPTTKPPSSLPSDSAMARYLALESGSFWVPAQVYNRENGHSGFLLSCYDAELSYNWRSNTFKARYPPHGRRPVVFEEGIPWDRIRAPPVGTLPHDLHSSDCLNDLRPGDHFEIQWRRNKEFPYGWWYGVVGHLESCDGSDLHCRCHKSDTVALEFNHYKTGSRWRHANINRKDHREEGNETDGFYGGIRKLQCREEISAWRRLWPIDNLQ